MADNFKFILSLATIFILMKQSAAVLEATCVSNTDCSDPNAECDTVTDMDGNGDGECVCPSTHKDNGGTCDAKVLGDPCGATSDCAAVSQATCDTNCVCEGQYKDSSGSCVQRGLGDACSATSDCAGVSQATCNTNCVCDGQYKESSGSCMQKGLADSCTADLDCSGVSNAVCNTNNCECGAGYETSGSTCSEAASVRASTILFATMFILALIKNSCTLTGSVCKL